MTDEERIIDALYYGCWRYVFREPIALNVSIWGMKESTTYSVKIPMKYWRSRLTGIGSSFEDAKTELAELLDADWNDYVLAPESELTRGAINYRKELQQIVSCVENPMTMWEV